MSYSSTSAAATSSCVDSGFDAQSTTSAPPAFSVRIRFAVSVVTCRQAEMRYPSSGFSRSNRSRISVSTGICRSAHMMRRTPSEASARSFTSWRFVVAMNPSCPEIAGSVERSRGEEPLVLALLPFDPGARVVGGGEPAVDRALRLRLAPRPAGERDICEVDCERRAQVAQRPQAVQLREPVRAVAAARALRDDQAVLLEVAQHPGRPARLAGGGADGEWLVHVANLTTT